MKNKSIKYLVFVLLIGAISCTPIDECTDGIQNGNETGVDCGGGCPACPIITNPTCTDGVQNGTETGIDCGGTCPACPVLPTCADGIQNGNETGVDCGGPDCTPCGVATTCTDGVMNGNETGIDCGGPDCPACFPFIFQFLQNGSLWSAQAVFLAVTSDYNVTGRSMDVFKSVGGNAAARFTLNLGSTPSVGSVYTISTSSISPPSSEAGVQYRPTGIYSSNVYVPINSNSGSVTITEYNTSTETIGGTFSTSLTNGVDTLVITNGEFTLPFED